MKVEFIDNWIIRQEINQAYDKKIPFPFTVFAISFQCNEVYKYIEITILDFTLSIRIAWGPKAKP